MGEKSRRDKMVTSRDWDRAGAVYTVEIVSAWTMNFDVIAYGEISK